MSVVVAEELRDHAGDASDLGLDRRAGESGSDNVGSPIYRLVS